MNDQKNNRIKVLHASLKESELKKIHTRFSSPKKKLSKNISSILLDKPITVYTLTQSLDDFLAEMILLRGELIIIENNYSQLVKGLHAISRDPDIKRWVLFNKKVRKCSFKMWMKLMLKSVK